jgi:TPR repeat protein
MCALIDETDDAGERTLWLTMAAQAGHVPAMYHLGLICPDPRLREHWLQEAARRGCVDAMAELAPTW